MSEVSSRAIVGVAIRTDAGLTPAAVDGIELEAPEVINRIRELTGIYGLGFRKSSMAGLMLPIAFVGFVAILSVLWFFVL